MHKCISDMDILITDRTKTRDILPFLTTGNLKEVLDKVQSVPLDTPIPEMTVSDFNDLLSAPEDYTLRMAKDNRKALVFLGKCKDLYNQLEGFKRFMSRFEYKQSAEEKQASNGIPFPSFGNQMVITLVETYHLHSVDEAGEMPVKAWMLAFEHNASQTLFSRRYNEIITKKSKMKK